MKKLTIIIICIIGVGLIALAAAVFTDSCKHISWLANISDVGWPNQCQRALQVTLFVAVHVYIAALIAWGVLYGLYLWAQLFINQFRQQKRELRIGPLSSLLMVMVVPFIIIQFLNQTAFCYADARWYSEQELCAKAEEWSAAAKPRKRKYCYLTAYPHDSSVTVVIYRAFSFLGFSQYRIDRFLAPQTRPLNLSSRPTGYVDACGRQGWDPVG